MKVDLWVYRTFSCTLSNKRPDLPVTGGLLMSHTTVLSTLGRSLFQFQLFASSKNSLEISPLIEIDANFMDLNLAHQLQLPF